MRSATDELSLASPRRRRLGEGLRLALAVSIPIVLCVVLSVVWILRFRLGYPTEWDESGYLAIAVNNTNALVHGGPVAFAHVVETQSTEAPLVPFLTAPVFAIAGEGMFQGLVVILGFLVLLLVSSFGVARRLMSRWWASLACLVVGAIPLVSDYSRLDHFSVPAAACMTTALWAFLRSDRLSSLRFSLLGGFMVGLMVLARTMTIAYLPGIGGAAAVLALTGSTHRRERKLHLSLAILVGGVVAATWYAHNWGSVRAYLVSSGYGPAAAHFGSGSPITSVAYWTRAAAEVANDLYLPLAALVLTCLVVGAVLAASRVQGQWRDRKALLESWGTSAWLPLALVVLEGYLAMTSSRNQGTAFSLPWLPALVLLAVAAVSRVPVPVLKGVLAALLAATAVGGLVMKAGFVAGISKAVSIRLPVLGSTTVLNGKGIIQSDVVDASGYRALPATQPFPAFQRRWPSFERRVASRIFELSQGDTKPVAGYVASNSQILSNTSFNLAAALNRQPVQFLFLQPYTDTTAEYMRQLNAPSVLFVITAPTPPLSSAIPLTLSNVQAAARASGFRDVESFVMPDGRRLDLWWRPARSRY